MWRRKRRAGAGDFDAKDAEVVSQLAKAGANLEQPLVVDHFLYFPSQRASEDVRDELSAEGYSVQHGPAPNGKQWSVKASRAMLITVDAITSERHRLTSLATTHGGEYDGWGAAVRPAPSG